MTVVSSDSVYTYRYCGKGNRYYPNVPGKEISQNVRSSCIRLAVSFHRREHCRGLLGLAPVMSKDA